MKVEAMCQYKVSFEADEIEAIKKVCSILTELNTTMANSGTKDVICSEYGDDDYYISGLQIIDAIEVLELLPIAHELY